MQKAASIAISIAAASVVPPVLFMAFILAVAGAAQASNTASVVLVVAWFVSLAHLLLLGLPVFFFLQRLSKLRWSTVAAAGFICGVVPIAIFNLPSHQPGYSSGANWYGTYVELYKNGEPTIHAWLVYAENCFRFGLLGVAAAIAYWRVSLQLSSKSSQHASNA